jgi:hypothetical protein
VCLDINTNGACDSSEPSTTTTDSGKYHLSDLTAGDENKYPVLVLVPATAVDSDNPTGTVGKPYFLSPPAGRAFVSPLTTLVQQKVAAGATVDSAEAPSRTSSASPTPRSACSATTSPAGQRHTGRCHLSQSLRPRP